VYSHALEERDRAAAAVMGGILGRNKPGAVELLANPDAESGPTDTGR
jgi:hypothetical protein